MIGLPTSVRLRFTGVARNRAVAGRHRRAGAGAVSRASEYAPRQGPSTPRATEARNGTGVADRCLIRYGQGRPGEGGQLRHSPFGLGSGQIDVAAEFGCGRAQFGPGLAWSRPGDTPTRPAHDGSTSAQDWHENPKSPRSANEWRLPYQAFTETVRDVVGDGAHTVAATVKPVTVVPSTSAACRSSASRSYERRTPILASIMSRRWRPRRTTIACERGRVPLSPPSLVVPTG